MAIQDDFKNTNENKTENSRPATKTELEGLEAQRPESKLEYKYNPPAPAGSSDDENNATKEREARIAEIKNSLKNAREGMRRDWGRSR